MITATLSGGLGNQMFMYAMVKAMALRNHTEIAFNIREGFDRDFTFKRSLELNHLNVVLPEDNLTTFGYGFSIGRAVRRVSWTLGRNLLRPTQRMIKESLPMRYEHNTKLMPCRNAYLEGYWQSEKYFDDCKDVIRADFRIMAAIPQEVEEEVEELAKTNRPVVFVGVRRYQECKKPSYLTEHVCDEAYYKEAMSLAKEKLGNPLFVVLSQDRKWCEEAFKEEEFVMAKEKIGELSTISDLYLMTHCNHAIISNSSFYWWGAWLQENVKKHLVIAPDNFINKDSVCDNWTVLHV